LSIFAREAAIGWLIWGKVLEIGGALLLAYVGLNAARVEISIGRHLHRDRNSSERPGPASGTDLEHVKAGMRELMELRKEQFGFYEAIAVATGTTLIAVGCLIYLVGLLIEDYTQS
jgi:hypothetical protein